MWSLLRLLCRLLLLLAQQWLYVVKAGLKGGQQHGTNH